MIQGDYNEVHPRSFYHCRGAIATDGSIFLLGGTMDVMGLHGWQDVGMNEVFQFDPAMGAMGQWRYICGGIHPLQPVPEIA